MGQKSVVGATSSLRVLLLASCVFPLLVTSGCGIGTTVDLTGGEAPPTHPGAPQKPAEATTPGSDSNSGDGEGGDQTTSPEPQPNRPASHRVVCQKDGAKRVTTSVHRARPDITAQLIWLSEVKKIGDSITRDFPLLEVQADATAGGTHDRFGMRLLFVASPMGLKTRRFYYSQVDLVAGLGPSVSLGSPPAISSSASSLARSMGLKLRNYGVSRLGQFVFLPSSGGFKILSGDDLRQIGSIAAGSNAFFPYFDEDKGVFSVLKYDAGGFTPELYRLSIANQNISFSRMARASVASGHSAFPGVLTDSNIFAWVSVNRSSLSGRKTTSGLTVGTLNLTNGEMQTYNVPPDKGMYQVMPAAVVATSDGPSMVVASEAVAKDQDGHPYLKFANVAVWQETAAGLELKSEMKYPSEITKYAYRKGILRQGPVASGAYSPFSSDFYFVSFESLFGKQLFSQKGGELDSFLADDCINPMIFTEAD